MGTEIFKEIRDSEKKARDIIEKAEKAKEVSINKAKEQALSIIDEAKAKSAAKSENTIIEKEKQWEEGKKTNKLKIEAELVKIRKTANKNKNKVVSYIIDNFL